MYQVIIAIHVLLGLGVIGLVMMQQGKGADAGASFGSGSAGSVFGAQGAASFLSRTTAILATCFFITSLGLAVINGHKSAAFDIINAPTSTDTPPIAAPNASIEPPAADTSIPEPNDVDVVTPPPMSKTAAPATEIAPATAIETPHKEVQQSSTSGAVKEETSKEDEKIEKIAVPKAEKVKTVDVSKDNVHEKKHADKHEKHAKDNHHVDKKAKNKE